MTAPHHSPASPPSYPTTTCLCGQDVIVVLLNMRDRMVDPEPDPTGDIQLRPGVSGTPIASRIPVARRFGKRDLRHVHQCPDARLVRGGPRARS